MRFRSDPDKIAFVTLPEGDDGLCHCSGDLQRGWSFTLWAGQLGNIPIPERSGGVYLIELMQPNRGDGQSIIYVGRTKRSLRRRMREFYKQRYGE
jgi:hypothetical protein